MNRVTEYDNIFHYFKGQSMEESNSLQNENNTTKALINVLQHGPKELTDKFIQLLEEKVTMESHYTYMIQVNERVEKCGKKAFILGISEEPKKTFYTDYTDIKSIPDAAIISDDVIILIETKIGSGSLLNLGQMEKHSERFHENQTFNNQLKYLSWNQIKDFIKAQSRMYSKETVTGFLLAQFVQFCEINGHGGVTQEHYFNHFPIESKRLAKEIDEYLWNGAFDIIEPPGTVNGIAYKRMGRRASFAKLCTDRVCLILRYEKKGSKYGEQMQAELDELIGKTYRRTKSDDSRYSHEMFIDLRWVKNLEQIKPFILKAYESCGKSLESK